MMPRAGIPPDPEDLVVSELLAGFDRDARAELASWVSVETFADGAVLFHEGDPGDALYVVLEGEAVIEAGGDRVVMLALAGAGDVIGEMALVDGRKRSATVRARGTLRALKLGRLQHQRLQEDRPKLAAALMAGLLSVLSSRLRESNRSLMTLFSTGQALASGLPAHEIAEQVLMRIARAIPAADAGLVAVLDDISGAFVPTVGFGVKIDLPSPLPVSRTGALVRALDAAPEGLCLGDADAVAKELAPLGYKWMLVTELRRQQQLHGFIALFSSQTLCPFTAANRVMLGVAGDQTAGALTLTTQQS